jgi:hypothetical protein
MLSGSIIMDKHCCSEARNKLDCSAKGSTAQPKLQSKCSENSKNLLSA